jgi:sulfotransferase family protein
MLSQMKYALKYILGRDTADGRLTVFPDDIFLVSYPRSGNTWIRFLLANLIYPNENVGFTNIGRLVADPARASKKFLRSLPRPRILKSHHPFDPRYRKVIYIVRDPRDVVISEYYLSLKKRRVDPSLSLDEFTAKRFLAGNSSDYGSWWENAVSWITARKGDPTFLLVRYEDLLRQTVWELSRIAEFLSIGTDAHGLQTAVDRSCFDRMRQIEQQETDLWEGTKDTRKDIPFVRAAKAGGWKSTLSQESIELIEAAWSPLLALLGYEVPERLVAMSQRIPILADGSYETSGDRMLRRVPPGDLVLHAAV